MADDEFDDGGADDEDQEPGCPPVVHAAAVIWVVVGALVVLSALVDMARFAAGGQPVGGNKPGDAGFVVGLTCGVVLRGLFAAALVYAGVRTIRGTAGDTLGNGVGSILFGLLQLGVGLLFLLGKNALVGLLSGGAGAILLAAGVLAIAARPDYKRWRRLRRKWRKQRRAARREPTADEE